MAAVDDVQKDGFSFTWTIQNFSYYAGTAVRSPIFVMSGSLPSKWCLVLYPKRMGGSYTIALNLKLLSFLNINNAHDYYKPVVSFELSICTPLGIFKLEGSKNEIIGIGLERGINSTILLKDLYKKKPEFDVNNDSLTVRCRILKVTFGQSVSAPSGQCHARTIIVIDKTTSLWNLQNFLDEFNKKRPKEEPIILLEKSSFTMEISSSGGGIAEEKIVIEIKPLDKYCLFSTCKMSLIGIDGKTVYSVRDEHRFELDSVQVWSVPFIPMNKLLERKELYLPNGTLSLLCEFAISSGATYHELKTNYCEMAVLNLLENCKQEKEVDAPRSLSDNLKCFYAKEKFTDLKIQTHNKEFPVHKTILCARSEVFSAMFESDTKEKMTGVIEIEDIDDDTVSKMLLFMYTDSVGEELDFEMTFRLYSAADKYGIVVLREKCADFLKGNLTMNNVCEVLVLADMHEDQELKKATQNFIFENRGEMMDSEEWSKLMQNHVQLASKTMRSFLRKC